MKADAVVFLSPHIVEFRQVQCPDPGPDDVVVRVTHSWISNGTEGSYLRGERIRGDTPYRPGDPTPFPIVPGYQKVGVVEYAGKSIHDLSPGDMVFCASGQVHAMFYPCGGHVSPSVSSRDQIWKLPSTMEPLAFSGMVLTQVGYNSGNRAMLEPGQYAVVIGDGLVGQWAAQTLTWRGAQVLMVGKDDYRLRYAQRHASCRTMNADKDDWVAVLGDLTGGEVAIAVDCAGSQQATEAVIAVMRHGGHIVSAGFCGTQDRISLQALRDQELTLHSVSAWTQQRMNKTLELIASGDLKTLPLITHHFPVNQASEAWQLINDRSQRVLGVVLDW